MPSFLACFRCGHPAESNAGSRSECSQRKTSAAVDKVVSLRKQDAGGFGNTAAASLGRSVSVASCGYSDEYTDCEASCQEEGCGHTRSHLSCSSTTDHASRTTCGLSRGSSSTAAAQPSVGALPAAGIRSHLPSARSHGRGRRMRNGRMGSARTSSHTHRHSSTPPTAAEAAAAAATSAAPVDGGVALPLTAEQMALALESPARPAVQAAAAHGATSPVPELHASTQLVPGVGAIQRESEGDRGSGGSRASAGRGRGSSCGSEPPTDFPTTGSAGERSSGGSSAPPVCSLTKADAGGPEDEPMSAAECDSRRLLGCSQGPLQEAPQLPRTAQQHQQQLIHQRPVDPLAFRFEPSALATLHHGQRSMGVPLDCTHDHEQQRPGQLQHSSSMPYAAAPWPSSTPHAAAHGPLPRSPFGPCWGPSPAPASASPGQPQSPAQHYRPSLTPLVLPPAPSLTHQTHAGGHASHFVPRLTAATSIGHSHSLTERCGSISRSQRAGAWATPPASPYHSDPRSHQQHLSPGQLRCGSCSSNTAAAPPLPSSPHNGTSPKTSVLLSKGLINTAASNVVRQRSAGVAPAGPSPGTCGSEDSRASVPILGRPLQRPQLPGRFAAPGGTRHRRSSLADGYGGRYGVPYNHVAGHGDARPEVMLVLEGGHNDGRCGGSVGSVPRDDLMYDLYDMRRQELEQHSQMVQVQRHLQQQNQSLREAFGNIRRAGSLTAGRVRTAAAGGGVGCGPGPSPSAQERERWGGRHGPGCGVGQQQQQVPGHRLWRARRASCSSVVEASEWY